MQVWWSLKTLFLTVSTLGGCGGPESGLESEQFVLLTVSTFGGCGGLERRDF